MITELIQWVVTNLWGPPTIELTGPWTESLLGGPPIIRLVELVGPWVELVGPWTP